MDILLILFLVIVFWGLRIKKHNVQYLNRDTTTAIKGIFAIIILFSHTRQYLIPSPQTSYVSILNEYNLIYSTALSLIGQLMVVMFLLYSGYGIVESYKRKKLNYTNGFLKKRVLKTLIHFDLAVLLFLLVALILGHSYTYDQYILSFTGWSSIGNSNWFVFDIIILYLLSYGGFLIVERHNFNLKKYLWIIFGLTISFAFFMYRHKEGYWWDTLLAYPTGMLWSVYKEQINSYLSDSKKYFSILFIIVILFCVMYYAENTISYGFALITSALFGVLIVMITMRFHIGNAVLYWLGINAFSIYILQRIPMIIISELGFNGNHILFSIIVFPLVFILAWGFTRLTNLIDLKFFK